MLINLLFKKYSFFYNHISGHACFTVSHLISWASVDRGWTGNPTIPSRRYFKYTTKPQLIDYMSLDCPMPLGTELFIVLKSKRVFIRKLKFSFLFIIFFFFNFNLFISKWIKIQEDKSISSQQSLTSQARI